MVIKRIKTTKCAKVLFASVTAVALTHAKLFTENVTTTFAKAHAEQESQYVNYFKQKFQDQPAVIQL